MNKAQIKEDIDVVLSTIRSLKEIQGKGQCDYQHAIDASYRDLEYLQNLLKHGVQRVEKQSEEARVDVRPSITQDGSEWWGESVWGRQKQGAGY